MPVGEIETEADLLRWIEENILPIPTSGVQTLPVFIAQPVTVPENVAPGTIEGSHIVTETIEAKNILAGTITGDRIAAGTIEGENISAETITGGLIAAGTITATNIAAGTITGVLIAAETIEGKHIKAGTIEAASIKAESITTEKLAAEAVTAAKIQAGTITAKEIAANTITAGQIKAGTITSTEIAAETITASDIEAHTLTAHEITAGTITSVEIAAATITGADIASATITSSNISVAELSALSANAGTITAGTITGATVRTAAAGKRVVLNTEGLRAYNAVEEAVLDFDISTGNLAIKGKILEGSVIPATTITGQLTNEQLKEIAAAKITGTIVETQIGAESISTTKLAASAVTSAKIAAGTIVAEDIASGTITATQIAGETITATQIKAGTITTTQIAASTILAEDIAASTITGSKIAAETITATNIAATTITAGKLNVSTLSAITADLGTVTAGTLKGTTIETSTGLTKLNNEGVQIVAEEKASPNAAGKIRWKNPAGAVVGELYGIHFVGDNMFLRASSEGEEAGKIAATVSIEAKTSAEEPAAYIKVRSEPKSTITSSVMVQAGVSAYKLLDIKGNSAWLQLIDAPAEGAKRKVNFSESTVEFTAKGIVTAFKSIEHKLGVKPTHITPTIVVGEDGGLWSSPLIRNVGEKTFEVRWRVDTERAAGTKFTFTWFAIG